MENVEILRHIIDQLQYKIEELTTCINTMQGSRTESFPSTCHQYFCSVRDVFITPPFYANPWDVAVTVMVDDGAGYFHQITPGVSFSCGSLSISLDVPRTGYVVVTHLLPPLNSGFNTAFPTGFYHRLSDNLVSAYPESNEEKLNDVALVEENETAVSRENDLYEYAMKVVP